MHGILCWACKVQLDSAMGAHPMAGGHGPSCGHPDYWVDGARGRRPSMEWPRAGHPRQPGAGVTGAQISGARRGPIRQTFGGQDPVRPDGGPGAMATGGPISWEGSAGGADAPWRCVPSTQCANTHRASYVGPRRRQHYARLSQHLTALQHRVARSFCARASLAPPPAHPREGGGRGGGGAGVCSECFLRCT